MLKQQQEFCSPSVFLVFERHTLSLTCTKKWLVLGRASGYKLSPPKAQHMVVWKSRDGNFDEQMTQISKKRQSFTQTNINPLAFSLLC